MLYTYRNINTMMNLSSYRICLSFGVAGSDTQWQDSTFNKA